MQKITQTEPYFSTYIHAKGRKLGLPITGNFELTARCNFNCPMCYVHLSNEQVAAQGGELTAKQWLDLAESAKNKGMLFALLTGGEPLVRKDFFEIYDGMRQMGLLITINSNGSMLKGKILERFLEAPPLRFNISLYGGSNETYSNMCGLPVYDDVKENIRTLRQAGINVSLNLSITPFNRHDLPKIYADAVELDVNVRASSYMYPPIRVHDNQYGCGNRLSAEESAACSVLWNQLRLSEEEFAARADRMENLIFQNTDGCPVEDEEGIQCRAGVTSFWIAWNGTMMPCGMMTTPVAHPLEVGFNAAWEQIRNQAAQIRTPGKCIGCNYRELCGACAAVRYTETGRFDAVPEYMCRRAEEIVKQTQLAWEKRKNK